MEYTREELIKAATILMDGCEQHTQRCDDCPFAIDKDDFVYCKLSGTHPMDWDYFSEEKRVTKRIVSFDFSLKEDRDAVMGKRIINESKGVDVLVTALFMDEDRVWHVNDPNITSEVLIKDFCFVDTGKPVGKEIEE